MGLKVTREEEGKLRQDIEIKKEKLTDQKFVTVMFHDRTSVLGSFESYVARAGVASSLSADLTGSSAFGFRPAPLSAPLAEGLKSPEKRRRRISSSLSFFEKFSAEASMAHSAGPVCRADLNASGTEVALTTINEKTEQRRCYAVLSREVSKWLKI